jgi:ABC-type branched-subunit amino acid transport system permease subunit
MIDAPLLPASSAAQVRVPRAPIFIAMAVMLTLACLPWFAGVYAVSLFRDALIFSLLALGLDFLWGKTGILSFGHAAFFGAGAYGVAVMSTKAGLDPAIASWVGMAAGIGIAIIVSGVVGYFLIFGGVRGPYFTIVTLALAVITDHIVVGWSNVTGGNAGVIGVLPLRFPTSAGGAAALSDTGQYLVILGTVSSVAAGLWWACRGRYGQILQAIEDNELRAQALGHDTSAHLLLVFVVSAAIAALGGALYASTVGFVAPDIVGLLLSTQAVVWVAVGGRGTFVGPVLATVLVIWLEQRVSSIDTKLWPLAIGALFIVSVFALPDGILGRLAQWRDRRRVRHEQSQAPR